MEITQRDIGILIAMSITVIAMSYIFPALGFAGSEVKDSDIPQFNMSTSHFDIVGDFPKDPSSPSTGELVYDKDKLIASLLQEWLHGDQSDGVRHTAGLASDSSNADYPTVTVVQYSMGSAVGSDTVDLTTENEVYTYNNASYQIEYNWTESENYNQSDAVYTVEYKIVESPDDVGILGRIPVVGGIFSSGSNLAAIVGWLASVTYWLVGTAISILLNFVATLLQIAVYVFGMFHWLLSTYFSIANTANGFASIIVMIPGIILFMQFAKIAATLIDIIWIG